MLLWPILISAYDKKSATVCGRLPQCHRHFISYKGLSRNSTWAREKIAFCALMVLQMIITCFHKPVCIVIGCQWIMNNNRIFSCSGDQNESLMGFLCKNDVSFTCTSITQTFLTMCPFPVKSFSILRNPSHAAQWILNYQGKFCCGKKERQFTIFKRNDAKMCASWCLLPNVSPIMKHLHRGLYIFFVSGVGGMSSCCRFYKSL